MKKYIIFEGASRVSKRTNLFQDSFFSPHELAWIGSRDQLISALLLKISRIVSDALGYSFLEVGGSLMSDRSTSRWRTTSFISFNGYINSNMINPRGKMSARRSYLVVKNCSGAAHSLVPTPLVFDLSGSMCLDRPKSEILKCIVSRTYSMFGGFRSR